jgi:DNA-binding NarL/FixJ family response regulator
LREAVDAFAKHHGLTPREHDVVYLLASGRSTVAQIASALGLSKNTVHNHFKNVFRRTQRHSMTSVLALLFQQSIDGNGRPRVLFVGSDPEHDIELTEALQREEILTFYETNPQRALDRINTLRIDAVVTEVPGQGATARPLPDAIRNRFKPAPLVLLGGATLPPGQGGFAELTPMPWDAGHIASAVRRHLAARGDDAGERETAWQDAIACDAP